LSIARYLLPRLVAFVTDTEPEDPEQARSLVAQTLCKYVASVDASKVAAAMAIVVPTLLARATTEGEEVYEETSSRLLELAAADQGAFRAVVGGMSGAQKAYLEEVIRAGRQAAAASAKNPDGESSQPSITLKMDFSG
jgi:HEAT repeat-containing protein 5